MRLTVSDPSVAPALIEALRACECLAEAVGDGVVEVLFPWIAGARDAQQALLELRFFARTWEAMHPGVQVTLAPSAP